MMLTCYIFCLLMLMLFNPNLAKHAQFHPNCRKNWKHNFVCIKSVQLKTIIQQFAHFALQDWSFFYLISDNKVFKQVIIDELLAVIPDTNLAHTGRKTTTWPCSMSLKMDQLLWLASLLHYTLVFPGDADVEPSRSAGLSRPTKLHTYRVTEVFVSVSTVAPQPVVAEGIPYRQRTDEDGTRCAGLRSPEC